MANTSVMQKAGRLSDEIIGLLKIDVIEAKDLAALDFGGTSDPYVKVYYDGFQNEKKRFKTAVIDKNLNPKWDQSFTSWIFDRNSSISLQVWDHDKLSKDDFAGQTEIPINFSDNWTMDEWCTLHGREGKKDKHVKGQIHIRITVRVLQRGPGVIWKAPTYIMIDPDYLNHMIEIQGNIEDELMMHFVSGISIPAPYKIYDAKGRGISWKVNIPHIGGFSTTEPKSLADRLQNYLLRIWNRWKELGWFYVSKSERNCLFLNYPHPAPWYQPPPQQAPAPKYQGYIFIDSQPLRNTFEIQGEIDKEVLDAIAHDMKLFKVEDKDGTLLRWVIKVPEYDWGLTAVSKKAVKRESFRFQHYMLRVFNTLAKFGYTYISDFKLRTQVLEPVETGQHPEQQHSPYNSDNHYYSQHDIREKSHIFYRDVNTYHYNKNVFNPSYLLVDPRPFAVKFAIQGGLDLGQFNQAVPGFPAAKEFKDRKDSHLAYEWKVKEAKQKIVFTQTGARRLENRYQNFMIRMFDGLNLLGYKYVIDIGKSSLFVKTGEPVIYSSHLMLDQSVFDGRLVYELQGNIDGGVLRELSTNAGLEPAVEIKDKDDSHLCWSFAVPKVTQYDDYHRIENRKQNYLLQVFDILNKAGYDYVTAQSRTHIFIKRHQIPTFPLTWLLLELYISSKNCLEIQGAISQEVIDHISKNVVAPPPNKVMDKDGQSMLCWAFELPSNSISWSQEAAKLNWSRNENFLLSVLNVLYMDGWITMDRADTGRGLFLVRYGWQPPQQ